MAILVIGKNLRMSCTLQGPKREKVNLQDKTGPNTLYKDVDEVKLHCLGRTCLKKQPAHQGSQAAVSRVKRRDLESPVLTSSALLLHPSLPPSFSLLLPSPRAPLSLFSFSFSSLSHSLISLHSSFFLSIQKMRVAIFQDLENIEPLIRSLSSRM